MTLQKSNSVIRLATVVLHYGNPALAQSVVAQLCAGASTEEQQHIFVLDNAAPKAYMYAQQDTALAPEQCIRLKENVYWAGALDFAWQHFLAKGYTHVWFLNNDISFVESVQVKQYSIIKYTIQRLTWLERLCNKGTAAKQVPAIGIYSPSALKNPYHAQMVHDSAQQASSVAYIDGIAPLVSLACIQFIHGVDAGDNTLGYGVDLWLSIRAQQAGWQVVVDHQNVIEHHYHSTAKGIAGFLEQAAQKEQAYLQERLGAEWRQHIKELSTKNVGLG